MRRLAFTTAQWRDAATLTDRLIEDGFSVDRTPRPSGGSWVIVAQGESPQLASEFVDGLAVEVTEAG